MVVALENSDANCNTISNPLTMRWIPILLVSSVACTAQVNVPEALEPPPDLAQAVASVPVPDVLPPIQLTAEVTPGVVELPEASSQPVIEWRPPPYVAPLAIRPTDHFYLTRPIPSGDVHWPNPRYRYGSTAFGEESTHTGVDLGADRNTLVLAAGSGEVIWTGVGLYSGQYDPNDPYGLAIAIRHDFGHLNQVLYTVYAHLQSSVVWLGQRVEAGEQIGTVGSSGHASGPHLHFEVRLGENRYFASRNPELWVVPAEGWGVLAGRIQDTFGNDLQEHQLQIQSVDGDGIWDVWTYAPDTIHPDEGYQENFVISDLPSGPYQVQISFLGRTYSAYLFVHPGQTNFLRFKGRFGYSFDDSDGPVLSSSPPYP
jgi:murein DD-endopeptidase MepM/ murein hydrolase activator NlpD